MSRHPLASSRALEDRHASARRSGAARVVDARLALMLLSGLALQSCGAMRMHHPPPQSLESAVAIPGFPDIRAWGDEFSPAFQADFVESLRQEQRSHLYHPGETISVLAISGGGGDGAFGAGLLCGWTGAGNRPTFKLVTGVSTGALTAPFAFLGSRYDDRLKRVYTTVSSKDIFIMKSLIGILQSDAVSLNDPLARLTTKYVDQRMLDDIAAEHARGRRLYVATTALDAQRPVIWNMGAIAASGRSDALELFRRVMIASAAVPVAFPPVYFPVDANGEEFDEMHVDGGVANQVFLYGAAMKPIAALESLGIDRSRRPARVYVIRNTRLKPSWNDVEPTIQSIAPRSVSSLIRAQGEGDLYRIFATAQRDGIDFNLAFIPDSLDTARSEEFDTRIMNLLFDTGYHLARQRFYWHKTPPGLTPSVPHTPTAIDGPSAPS